MVLATLPLERLLTFEVFGYTAKLSNIFAILLVAFFGVTIFSRTKMPKIAKEEFLLLTFVLWSAIGSNWSLNPTRTIMISTLLLLVFLSFMILRRKMGEKDFTKYADIFIITALLVSAFGLWQFFTEFLNLGNLSLLRPQYKIGPFPFPRIQSTLLEPQFLGSFMIISSYLAALRYLKTLQKKYLLIYFVFAVTLFLTLSRGAIFSYVISFAILFAFTSLYRKEMLLKLSKLAVASILSFCLVMVMIFSFTGSNGVNSYLHQVVKPRDIAPGQVAGELESLNARESTKKVATQEFLSHPVLGIGTSAFGALSIYQNSANYETVNNEYLEILAENGLVGFLLLAGFLLLYLKFLRKNSFDSRYLILGSATLAILVQYLFFSTLYILYIWFFLAMAWPKKDREVS